MPLPVSPSFPPATYADWQAQTQKDLRDPAAPEGLRWQTPEGFTAEPYYTTEQLAPLGQAVAEQQRAQKATPGWLNMPAYTATTGAEKIDNATLKQALANGADALLIDVPVGLDITRLLDGIKLSSHPVFFRLAEAVPVVSFLEKLIQIAPYQLQGGILARSGTLPPAQIRAALALVKTSPLFRVLGIDAHDFHEAGATATQELAFMLARLLATFRGVDPENPGAYWPSTVLSVSVGTSYFMEMAKLRALRVLLARLATDTLGGTAPTLLIHARTSAFYEAAATPYTNLLRATTEAMAAVIGGADLLTVRPYDAVMGPLAPTEFSHRIARNVSTLLSHESHLDKVADPAAGSYYIETLTHQLVETAWTLFQQMEAMGGYEAAQQSGFIQTALEVAYAARLEAVKAGRVLVGVTKFRHDEAGVPNVPEDGLGQAGHRLAEPFE